jgi:hypothetical protein
MRSRGWLLLVALAGGTGAASSPVRAPEAHAASAPTPATKEKASSLFKAGVAAFKKHKYAEAAGQFEKAFDLVPHPTALWNAADAREKAGELATAANLYTRYLAVAPDSDKDRGEAQARLSALTPKLGRLDIRSQDATRITVDEVAIEGTTPFVDPGDHAVAARLVEGRLVSKRVSVEAGSRVVVRLELEPKAPAEPAAASTGAAATAAKADEAAPPKKGGLSPAYVYLGAGLTVALGGLTIWSGLDANKKRWEFDTSPTAQGYDDGVAAQNRTNILIGATAAVGAATLIVGLFAVRWGDDKPGQPTVSLGPNGASVGARF